MNEKDLLSESMKFANAAAFLTVTKQGAMSSIPNLEEVKELIKNYEL